MPQIDQNDEIDGIEKIDGIGLISRRGRYVANVAFFQTIPKTCQHRKAETNI